MSSGFKRSVRLSSVVLGIFVVVSTHPGIASGTEWRGPEPKCETRRDAFTKPVRLQESVVHSAFPEDESCLSRSVETSRRSSSATDSERRSRRRFGLGGQVGGFYSFAQIGADARFWCKKIGADVSFSTHAPSSPGSGYRKVASQSGYELSSSLLADPGPQRTIGFKPYAMVGIIRVTGSEATYEIGETGARYASMQGPSEPITDLIFGGGTEICFKDLPDFAVSGDVMFAKQLDVVHPRILIGARYYFW